MGAILGSKSLKIDGKNDAEIDPEKVAKNDAKMMQKWIKNRCKIRAFHGRVDFWKRRFRVDCLQTKTRFGSPKIDEQSIKNRCKIGARKSEAEMMKNGANMEAKGEPKSGKNKRDKSRTKQVNKSIRKMMQKKT